MHHRSLDGVRMAEDLVGGLDTTMCEQVSHVRRAPHAHFAPLMLLAPRAQLRLGHAFGRIHRLPRLARHLRGDVGRHAHMTWAAVVDDLKLEHAGGLREDSDGLHIASAVGAHRRIRSQHQRAHAQFADHLAEEEAI